MFGIHWSAQSSRKTRGNKNSRTKVPRRISKPRLYIEPLENRTVLSVSYVNAGQGLSHIFSALQTGLNSQLWQPKAGFSLPLLGTDLASNSAGQFLSGLGSNLLSITPTDSASLISKVKTAIPYATVTVTGGSDAGSETDFRLTISGQALSPQSLSFLLGLPGIDQAKNRLADLIQQVEQGLNVTANLTYSLNVFFKVDANAAITLDTTQNTTQNNSKKPPLVSFDLSASYDNTNTPISLSLFQKAITLQATGKGSLTFGATLNDAAASGGTYDSTSLPPNLTTNVTLGNDSHSNPPKADFDVNLALATSSLPSVQSDVKVSWPLGGTNPFDSSALTNPNLKPTITFDVGIDLSSLTGWLNPIFDGLKQKLAPIEPIVDSLKTVLETKIPILGDLLPDYSNLEKILETQGVHIEPLVAFLNAIDGILHWSNQSFSLSGPLTLASYTLPGDDPRTANFDLAKLLDLATHNVVNDGQNQLSALEKDIRAILPAGKLDIPMLTDPLNDLKALLLGQNVVLVQYQFPHLDPKQIGVYTTLPPIPILPPLELVLGFGFGISGDLTIGYDSSGFSKDWDPQFDESASALNDRVAEGIFLASPTDLQFTGTIGLGLQADLGIAQVGGTGTLNLTFGVTGLHEVTAMPQTSGMAPYHTPYLHGSKENVLQLGDILYDVSKGTPLCPFSIGGNISIGLQGYVKIGVDPFSITIDVDFGNFTIASLTLKTCGTQTGIQLASKLFDPSDPELSGDLSKVHQNNPSLPGSANDIDALLKKANPNYAGTKHFLLLYLGQLDDPQHLKANNLNVQQQRETFQISPIPKTNDLQVSAFGLSQQFTAKDLGFDPNDPSVTIVAFGSGDKPEDVNVQSGVKANAVLFGGSNQNNFEYSGTGDAYLVGGTWDGNAKKLPDGQLFDPNANPPKGAKTLNTLAGGSGHNYLQGGGLSPNPDPHETAASWNVLKGGNGSNTLQAGVAGATVRAGDLNGDLLLGCLDSKASGSQFVMVAGQGNDLMYGGYGSNVYEWHERDDHQPHLLTVYGSAVQGIPQQQNQTQVQDDIEVTGNQGFESWTVDHETIGFGARIYSSVGTIDAFAVQDVGVDAEDSKNTGGENYLVNDLSSSRVQHVNVNLHQWTTKPDRHADHVIINGPQSDDTVVVDVKGVVDHFDPQTMEPVYSSEYTDISIATVLNGAPGVDQRHVQYHVRTAVLTTAVPKKSDTLDIYTYQGNDNVTVLRTQSDQTYINTGDGDDAITVGNGILDDIEGPLVVDAATGHNQILFNEAASVKADIATLTTNLKPVTDPQLSKLQDTLLGSISQSLPSSKGYLLRYKGEFIPGGGGPLGEQPPHYRFPAGITFLATGGDFSPPNGMPGVVFDATFSSDADKIYVDSVLPNAPTLVNTEEGPDQIYAGFDGGPTGATSSPKSTLDYLFSALTVSDNGGYLASLLVDDQGTNRADTYVVDAVSPQNGRGSITRQKFPVSISYQDLARLILLTPTTQDNTIDVFGTVKGTLTTVSAGKGDNTIGVGDPLDRLDNVLGPLEVVGGPGKDGLTIDDKGNGFSQTYTLSATQFVRQSFPPVSVSFFKISSLVFSASTQGNNAVIVAGTPLNVPVMVYPGDGTDQLEIDNLDHIRGPLILKWTQGQKNLVADDGGTASAQTYTLLANELDRTGAAPITFGQLVHLGLVVGVNHSDTVKVQAINPGTAVDINAGNVSTTVLVADSSKNLDAIQGPLGIHGIGAPTQAMLEDENATARRSYFLNQATFQVSNLPVISFSQLTGLVLDAGNHANHIFVNGTAAGNHVTIHAGTNDSTVVGDVNNSLQGIHGRVDVAGKGPNDFLDINDTGGMGMATYVLTATEVDHSLTAAIGYLHLKGLRLAGSTKGVDIYQIQGTPAGTMVRIVAGGTSNTLDYSSYSGSVVVDLQTGFATGLSGGISGIQNVIGGNSGPAGTYNLLIGVGGNFLQGGTSRRNILVAGASASTLNVVGGNEDELLIAATTNYDTEAGLVSWLKIAAYWAGTDAFATRVTNLQAGAGVPKLDASTVTGNGGGNLLIGLGQLALIYSDGKDIIPFPFFFDPQSKTVTITP